VFGRVRDDDEETLFNNNDVLLLPLCKIIVIIIVNPSAQNDPWSLTNSTIGIRDRLARYLGITQGLLSM
jgi:hypothetical protein